MQETQNLDSLKKDFLNPNDEYTPIPFWFWNDDLNEAEITRQINDFYSKGVMGFVIHPRIGIPAEIEYLSDRFMELVKCAVVEAKKLGMTVVLYDEAMYPSGSAHGMVVKKNPAYASRGLKMTEHICNGPLLIDLSTEICAAEGEKPVLAAAVRKLSGKEIDPEKTIILDMSKNTLEFTPPEDGEWSVLIFKEVYSKGHIRGIHFGEDDKEPNAPPSSDLLNPNAVREFLNITHERYYEVLHEYFGNTIMAMFTDEPSILGRGGIKGLRAWTNDFLSWFLSHGGRKEDIPLLWFDGGKKSENARNIYRKAVTKKLEQSYYGQISKWCEEHGIALTGHPERSDEIGLLKYFHIPGQDVVWRWVAPEDGLAIEGTHSTMAKCASDAARHSGKRRNANECFACCGKDKIEWSFTAEDMKWYMDWLFVRGVNLLYPHAFFYSIRGERRIGERPPDVGPNNIWWPYYRQISDYIKRMCSLLTDCVNITPVAVLCQEDHLPWQIVKPLYQNQIEFNYLEDNLLKDRAVIDDKGYINIAAQKYNVLVIEDLSTISDELREVINKFAEAGGNVIAYNPDNKDTGISGMRSISQYSEVSGMVSDCILPDVIAKEKAEDLRVTHIVKEGIHFYLFVNEGEGDINTPVKLKLKGRMEKWDPWNGEISEFYAVSTDENYMEIQLEVKRRESVIICVNPKEACQKAEIADNKCCGDNKRIIKLDSNWQITGVPENVKIRQALGSWTENEDLRDFSGTLTYTNSFTLEGTDKMCCINLDLGEVHEIAHLIVNGKDAGVRMWRPYSFDIKPYVKEGVNKIEVEVTNTLANRISKANISSGLIGNVMLTIM